MSVTDYMADELQRLHEKGNYRSLPEAVRDDGRIETDGRRMINLSSNDYLGLGADKSLREEFLERLTPDSFLPTSSSSRLLTGNFPVCGALETLLAERFGTESALLLGSGYHANTGILPAVTDNRTVILADKLVHASLIDGMRLSQARMVRYRHNDLEQLERLAAEYTPQASRTIIVTESLFSMDGDQADLKALVAIKRKYPNTMLYVDEAHAFGVRGERGLGCAEQQGCITDIDFLVGTFGKAAASVGAYIVCSRLIRDYLVNRMRTFIFTTALPPVNWEWTKFVVERMPLFGERRSRLAAVSSRLRQAVQAKGYACPSSSHIVPVIIGPSADTLHKASELQGNGFYALAVRPPTVPEGTSRIRLSLTADITPEQIDRLTEYL